VRPGEVEPTERLLVSGWLCGCWNCATMALWQPSRSHRRRLLQPWRSATLGDFGRKGGGDRKEAVSRACAAA